MFCYHKSMSALLYTPLQLARLSVLELERIVTELGLPPDVTFDSVAEERDYLTNRILVWQAGKNIGPLTEVFGAGMLTGPAEDAYGKLLSFYDTKVDTSNLLSTLSPLVFEGLLSLVENLPTLPEGPDRLPYLLMLDQLTFRPVTETSKVAGVVTQLQTYYREKDEMYRYLLTLSDAVLFSVVDQTGATLTLSDPYVQINGVKYQDNLEVVYYLIVLITR